MQTSAANVLFVLVVFDNGSEHEFAIVDSMPMVEFAKAIRQRFPERSIKRVTFQNAPANLPRVAEVL